MDSAITIKDGYYIVDPYAWVAQRVGAQATGYTESLREFRATAVFGNYHPQIDDSDRMQLWCTARGWTIGEGMPIYHDKDGLDEPITVVLAVSPDQATYALVQVGTDAPTVYPDLTTDAGYWWQTREIVIACPGGHRWTWLEHYDLIEEHGTYLAMTDVFGRQPGAPYSRCRDCAAYDDGTREDVCRCDSPSVIYCPNCGERCRLDLAGVATHRPAEQLR